MNALRDDGPLARAIGALRTRLPASLLVALGLAPLAIAIALGERGEAVVAAAFAWLILLGGLSRGGEVDRDRFRWTVPPLLRAGEYAALIWLAPAAALAVLVPLAFRHYDLVYRPRYQRGRAPADLGGGWDGRLVLAWALLALGALPEGLYVLGGILGALFAADAVASWLHHDPEGDAPA